MPRSRRGACGSIRSRGRYCEDETADATVAQSERTRRAFGRQTWRAVEDGFAGRGRSSGNELKSGESRRKGDETSAGSCLRCHARPCGIETPPISPAEATCGRVKIVRMLRGVRLPPSATAEREVRGREIGRARAGGVAGLIDGALLEIEGVDDALPGDTAPARSPPVIGRLVLRIRSAGRYAAHRHGVKASVLHRCSGARTRLAQPHSPSRSSPQTPGRDRRGGIG